MSSAVSQVVIRPVAGAIGAEISGIDIGEPLSPQDVARINEALLAHCVVFFRGQDLSLDQHKAFTRNFGTLYAHPMFVSEDGDPHAIHIVRAPGDKMVVGDDWHSDTTFAAAPPMGSVLYGVDVPQYGGDTMFANQYLAYEALSPGMKRMLEALRAVHSDRNRAGPQAVLNAARATKVREDANWRETINLHPVVRTHPVTGRKALYVNRMTTLGLEDMKEEESRPLLEFLFVHAVRPEFTCRFRWENGSVAFWDNRCCQHFAINDTGHASRRMRRLQLKGDRPF